METFSEKNKSMKDIICLEREDLLNTYKNASDEQKEVLRNLFGAETFKPKDVTERIKTFEKAISELGEEHQYVKAYREWMRISYAGCKDVTAYLKLRIIVAALNEWWFPKWKNENEYKYFPLFCLYTEDEYKELDEEVKERCCRVVGRSSSVAGASGGLVYAHAFNASSGSNTSIGSRLAFRTRELALYAGKQFIDLWCDFLF